jgi:hypothetical protein
MQQSARFLAAARPTSVPRAASRPAAPRPSARVSSCLPPSPSPSLAHFLCALARSVAARLLAMAMAAIANSQPPPCPSAAPCLAAHSNRRSLHLSHLTRSLLAVGVACSDRRRRCSRRPRVAKPPWATSGRAEASGGCVRTPCCSPTTRRHQLPPLRPDSASPDDLPVQNPVRDLLQKFDESQGSNYEVSDSDE